MCSLRHLGKNPDAARARIEAGAAKGIRYGLWKLGNLEIEAGEFREALELYKLAANLGLALAARAAGWMYANGIGCQQPDLTLARFYFEVASDSGCGRSALEAGLSHLYGKGCEPDVDQAKAFLKKAADAGVPKATSYLTYVEATGTAPLESQGQSLLKLVELCREGNAAADFAVGICWLEGMPGWVNIERAISAFQYAAERGCPKSKLELARLTLTGNGIERDVKRALLLFTDAANAGNVEAMAELGNLLLNGSQGVPADIEFAIRCLERAIENGSIAARFVMGKHLAGSSERYDLERAKALLETSVDAGSVEAAHGLAYLIEKEASLWSDSDRNDRLAVCAEMGCVDAMLMLAKDAQGRDERLFWLQASVDDGCVFGLYAIGCEIHDSGTAESSAEALAYWRMASKCGSMEATAVLADLFYSGNNRMKRDLCTAARYFDILANNGDLNAKATLDQLRVRGIRVTEEPAAAAVLSLWKVGHGGTGA